MNSQHSHIVGPSDHYGDINHQYGIPTNSNSSSLLDRNTCNLTYSNTSYDDGSSFITTDIDSTSYFTRTDDDSTSCTTYSETTCDTFITQRRNHHHKHSQNNSHSDATAVHCLTVHLVLTNENFLGLHIYASAVNGVDEGIYVDDVTENSAVAIDGRIEPGDKLIQVNETSLEELSNEEAIRILKEAVIKRGPLKLVVAKFVETNLDNILGPKDAIHPIDTAAWVAHAQAITIPHSATSSPSFGSNPQDTRSASTGIARLTTDIEEIIQQMKMPNTGLDIKDREWLKIIIPNAFLGSELVNWLRRNVYGFESNRAAKKFASRMLKEGYIRDPISKKSFSSKMYYSFIV